MKRGRKSSNNTFTENGKKIWKCGKYKRLSKEDGHDVSYSIENQKQILQDFARREGYRNTQFFVDDGVSGTTFQREGFQQMQKLEFYEWNPTDVSQKNKQGIQTIRTSLLVKIIYSGKNGHEIANQLLRREPKIPRTYFMNLVFLWVFSSNDDSVSFSQL